MPFCPNCGTQHEAFAAFCPSCGTKLQGEKKTATEATGGGLIAQIRNAPDHTPDFDAKDIEQNKALALLSYIGLLVLIPILCVKHSKFTRFHANQGLILCIVTAAVGLTLGIFSYLSVLFWPLWFLTVGIWVAELALVALAVLGIINAVRGKAKELPFIGKYRILK